MPFLGSKINLISMSEIRYEGEEAGPVPGGAIPRKDSLLQHGALWRTHDTWIYWVLL